jgi:hypothetical protein
MGEDKETNEFVYRVKTCISSEFVYRVDDIFQINSLTCILSFGKWFVVIFFLR